MRLTRDRREPRIEAVEAWPEGFDDERGRIREPPEGPDRQGAEEASSSTHRPGDPSAGSTPDGVLQLELTQRVDDALHALTQIGAEIIESP